MNHFDKLESLFYAGPINKIHKPHIKVSEGFCSIKQTVDPGHFHAGMALHGSVLFKLLDDSAFFAANSMEDEYFVLTGTFNIKFIAPVTSGELIAKGEYVDRDGRKIKAKSKLFVNDNLVAQGEGVFIVSQIPLSSL